MEFGRESRCPRTCRVLLFYSARVTLAQRASRSVVCLSCRHGDVTHCVTSTGSAAPCGRSEDVDSCDRHRLRAAKNAITTGWRSVLRRKFLELNADHLLHLLRRLRKSTRISAVRRRPMSDEPAMMRTWRRRSRRPTERRLSRLKLSLAVLRETKVSDHFHSSSLKLRLPRFMDTCSTC